MSVYEELKPRTGAFGNKFYAIKDFALLMVPYPDPSSGAKFNRRMQCYSSKMNEWFLCHKIDRRVKAAKVYAAGQMLYLATNSHLFRYDIENGWTKKGKVPLSFKIPTPYIYRPMLLIGEQLHVVISQVCHQAMHFIVDVTTGKLIGTPSEILNGLLCVKDILYLESRSSS